MITMIPDNYNKTFTNMIYSIYFADTIKDIGKKSNKTLKNHNIIIESHKNNLYI